MIDGFEDGTEYQMRKGECSKGFVNTLFDNQEGNFYFISGHKEELQGHSQMWHVTTQENLVQQGRNNSYHEKWSRFNGDQISLPFVNTAKLAKTLFWKRFVCVSIDEMKIRESLVFDVYREAGWFRLSRWPRYEISAIFLMTTNNRHSQHTL